VVEVNGGWTIHRRHPKQKEGRTPSVVAFTKGWRAARGAGCCQAAAVTTPEYRFSIKALHGTEERASREETSAAYKGVEGTERPRSVEIKGKAVHAAPPEILARIHQKQMKKNGGRDHLGHKVEKAVITVLPTSTNRRRQATKSAGKNRGPRRGAHSSTSRRQ